MTRIPPVEPIDLRPKITSRYGEACYELHGIENMPMLYRVLGNSPAMLSAWLDVAWALRYEATSPRGLRELAILLVGHHLEAPYCIGAHERMARAEGIPDDKIAAITDWKRSPHFTDDERIVLHLADAMLRREAHAELLEASRVRFGPEQTIELVLTIAFYQMVAATTTALDLAPERR
jgi:AhpD family alkylhydroperoxidase